MSRFWAAPDAALAAAGLDGEQLVARARLTVMALVLITPTWKLLRYPDSQVFYWGFLVTLAGALAALAIWWLLRRGYHPPWFGFATSALDVSLVSTALATFMVVDTPIVALNSTVTFEIYFLVIAATSLRYDARIVVCIGGLAIAQYGAMWAYAAQAYDLRDPVHAIGLAGYSPVNITTRLILLTAAVVLALEVVRRARGLLYLAARDRLTGLYNRGHFDNALALELERAARSDQPLALVVLDVDHFKRINDELGHATGDEVLRRIAERLEAGIRRTDIVARFGGEEFVLLMPDTDSAVATERTELLRRALSSDPLRLADGRQLGIAFSAGVAVFPADADEPMALFKRADQRLLAAKRGGRGRTVTTDGES